MSLSPEAEAELARLEAAYGPKVAAAARRAIEAPLPTCRRYGCHRPVAVGAGGVPRLYCSPACQRAHRAALARAARVSGQIAVPRRRRATRRAAPGAE